MPTIHADQLERLATRILRAAGANEHEAETVARHLVDANLAGHDSHGAMRVLQYVAEIEAGQIVPGASMRVLDDWETGAVFDARGCFGQVACREAMQRAIEKSQTASVAAVTLRHASHSGRLGAYVAQAAAAGMIGVVMANGGGAGQWVAPFGGRERRLSTNPIAIGAPSGGPYPFLLDISTSVAPEGKVRDHLQRQQPAPDGWLVDGQGNPTTDPRALYANPGGALLPLGGTSGHKGFGLAFMVDVFAGALSAAGCPCPANFNSNHGSGLFMLAIDVQCFGSLKEFTERVGGLAAYCKSSSPAMGFDGVLVPGEIEFHSRLARERDGIDISDNVWTQLTQLAQRLGMSGPWEP